MSAHRTRGIFLSAWAVMVIGVLEFVFILDFHHCTACSHTLPRPAVIAVFIFSAAAAIAGIAVGRGILRLHESARRAGIVLALFNIAAGVVLDRLAGKDMYAYVYGAVDYLYSSQRIGDPFVWFSQVLAAVSVIIWAVILFRVGFVVYFMLPRIRKNFS